MSKHPQQRLPKEDVTPSKPGAGRGKGRFKPLAPKGLVSAHETPQLQRSRSVAGEAAQQLRDLTFVNMTDPQQSKSSESRKFVRTQVMKNFAKEKRMKTQSSEGSSSPHAISAVQELLNVALPIAEDSFVGGPSPPRGALPPNSSTQPPFYLPTAHLGGPLAPLQASPAIARTRSNPQVSGVQSDLPTVSGTSFVADTELPHWPVFADPGVQGLLSHCHSPTFQACHPQYMISLLAGRPFADHYPLFVDIESPEQHDDDPTTSGFAENELYQLAQRSPMVAHALLMASASHLRSTEGDPAVADRQVIFHKDHALQLLKEAIKDLPAENYLETLATIAILASHELMVGDYNEWTVHLMGFGRILNMKGGITSLAQESLIRKLIIWTDQMGALLMNMRPFFPATEIMSLFFRPRTTIAPLLLSPFEEQDFLSRQLRTFTANFHISTPLIELLEDIATVRTVGPENILNASPTPPNMLSPLIDMRDVLLHRVLSMAPAIVPAGTEYEVEDESSDEECIRLAALIFILDRLFLPVLPPAYHRIMHMITERLNTTIAGKSSSPEWSHHAWIMMWIIFVGATVHNGDPGTRRLLIHSAVPLCNQVFNGRRKTTDELRVGLTAVMGRLEPYEEELIDGFAADLKQEYKS